MSEKKHILIVDDDEDSVFLVHDLLKDKYRCSTAQNIRDAKTIISNEHPDIVISDLDLSGTSFDEPDTSANALSETIRTTAITAHKRIGMIIRTGLINDVEDVMDEMRTNRDLKRLKHARFPVVFLSKTVDDIYNIEPTIEAMQSQLDKPRGAER